LLIDNYSKLNITNTIPTSERTKSMSIMKTVWPDVAACGSYWASRG